VFGQGLPEQFSFVTALRLTGKTTRESWDLLRIDDLSGNSQFRIRLDGRNRGEISLHRLDHENHMQIVAFKKNPVITKVK